MGTKNGPKKNRPEKDSFFNNEKGFGVKAVEPEAEGFVHFSNIATDGVKSTDDPTRDE